MGVSSTFTDIMTAAVGDLDDAKTRDTTLPASGLSTLRKRRRRRRRRATAPQADKTSDWNGVERVGHLREKAYRPTCETALGRIGLEEEYIKEEGGRATVWHN